METKACTKCKEIKPREAFYKDKSRKDGKCPNCVACMKAYREERREYYNAKHQEWRARHLDHVNAYNREWEKTRDDEHKDKRRKYKRDLARKAHRDAIDAYGGFCACCGETEPKFLQLDHMNNDGAEHRRQIKGVRLGPWLRRRGYPEGFQVLCANCNFAKHTNGGMCPHQEKVEQCLRG